MSLRGPEEDKFDLRSEMGFKDFILAAKFHTKRVLNVDAVARNFSQLWRIRNGFKIKDQGNHTVLFIFENKVDSNRILSSQPWSFDKFLVVFQKYENNSHVRDLDFEKVPFWVQVYNIPFSFMNKTVAKGICSGIGEVVPSDFSVMEGDCEQWFTSEGSLTVEDRKYGAWLRAPLSNQIRKSTIAVPGFYQQNRDSRVSKEEGCGPSSNSPQVPSSELGTPMKPLEKVTPISVPPNSAAYPSVRILDDLPPSFGGQPITKK
ncbi:hypothetical protein SO802_005923 [Lithocarpus litseifolius]|uniref:DUF4283 domain-containing protein n=1 Tax=Lithocarpus litseifolius TaxID=425828 RepID=A0AAW2DJH5_9ROSI